MLSILLFAVVFLFPLYWIVTMAFKPQDEWQPATASTGYRTNPTLENFKTIFGRGTETGLLRGGADRRHELDREQPRRCDRRDAPRTARRDASRPTGSRATARAAGCCHSRSCSCACSRRSRSSSRCCSCTSYLELVDTLHRAHLDLRRGHLPVRRVADAELLPGGTSRDRGGGDRGRLHASGAHSSRPCCRRCKGGLAATALFVFILNWSDFLIALVLTAEQRRDRPRLPERAAVRLGRARSTDLRRRSD